MRPIVANNLVTPIKVILNIVRYVPSSIILIKAKVEKIKLVKDSITSRFRLFIVLTIL